MKVIREIYDFVTGGSIVAPVGLAIAIVAAIALQASSLRIPIFVAIIALTFVASTLEKPT